MPDQSNALYNQLGLSPDKQICFVLLRVIEKIERHIKHYYRCLLDRIAHEPFLNCSRDIFFSFSDLKKYCKRTWIRNDIWISLIIHVIVQQLHIIISLLYNAKTTYYSFLYSRKPEFETADLSQTHAGLNLSQSQTFCLFHRNLSTTTKYNWNMHLMLKIN